ncbi:MAG: hypothetical protein ACOYMZ_03560 [Minisyncoccia bacterium]
MPRPFSDYTEQFFWSFKRMDNANYNFEIVEVLYKAKRENGGDRHFNKPIILHLMAIIECTLYDFFDRARQFTSDPFPNIAAQTVDDLRAMKETDELKRLLPEFEAKNVLAAPAGSTIYTDLEHLRIIRNRIHVQNRYNSLSADEINVFTDAKLRLAQECFEKVCEALCNVYPRWNKQPLPMADFPRPWL